MDIKKVCWKIVSTFDYDETTNPFQWGGIRDDKPPDLTQFIANLVEKDQWKKMKKDMKRRNEKLTQRDRGIFEESFALTYQIPFAFGYVIGQMFDIPSPEIQKEIDKIKTVLRDKALLPYLPRERKGGKL